MSLNICFAASMTAAESNILLNIRRKEKMFVAYDICRFFKNLIKRNISLIYIIDNGTCEILYAYVNMACHTQSHATSGLENCLSEHVFGIYFKYAFDKS